jgi:DNA-binding response OmpR family regulator
LDDTFQHRGGTETVLLVEDEEMLLDLLATILTAKGYNVLTAKDGLEGLRIYTEQPDRIALVISDMGLPKLGGWEMFRRMKEINKDVRAILASGYLDPNIRIEMIEAGAKDFIQKPYEPETMLKRIRDIIDGVSPS